MLITDYRVPEKNYTKRHKEALKILDRYDWSNGIYYYSPLVKYLNTDQKDDILINYFKVNTYTNGKSQDVVFKMNNKGTIISGKCNCREFKDTNSCRHLAAAIYNYYFDILEKYKPKSDPQKITSELFDYFKEKRKSKIKEKLSIETYIKSDYEYNYCNYELSIKIGLKQKYICKNSKLSKLLKAIENEEKFELGKNFTLDLNEQYLSSKEKEIIDFLKSISDEYYNIQVNQNSIKHLIEITNTENLYINKVNIKEIKETFPIKANLNKKEGNYIVDFNEIKKINIITDDFEYILKGNTLHHLSKNKRELFKIILLNDIDKLYFKESEFKSFQKSVLPMVKTNLEIDKSLEDIIINTKPTVKIYFDLYKDTISSKIKLKYSEKEIDYFEEDETIIRDEEYEKQITDDLTNCGFTVLNRQIIIDGLDEVVYFLENDIEKLSEKYEIFTSEKLKQTNIIKKSNVKATFSIGKDNILSYKFDLGNIDEKEISNVLDALNDKRKYYRLKSGDIINLNDKDLKDLNELTIDLDISRKEINKKKKEIPKYKAIYLDSLKKDKYEIIKTNNLFDDLIEKFRKYKKGKIHITKKDKETLRNYQIDGIKWLTNISTSGFGGILADEMGLGKTIQTVYLIKEYLKQNKDYKFLIVVPTSLAYNWEEEFKKYGKNIKYKILVGNKEKRKKEQETITKTNVLITTYGLLREDLDYYQNINFEIMIIDEAQNIKNTNAKITKAVKTIKANTKIALTGTPIENSVTELWSIFDYIMPGYLGKLKTFQKKYKVENFNEDTDKRIKILTKQIEPFILRRKKKDVIKDLPDKIERNIYVELTEEQKKLYLAELERVKIATQTAMKEGGMKKVSFLILSLLTTLRQICIHPKLAFNSYKGKSSKIEEFVNVIKNAKENNHKILVFTSFRTALELAREKLTKEGISSYVIDGSTTAKKRIKLVNNFNKNDTDVFFIMIKAGGTGLNLTGADIVIHLDLWWNPQAENQATDRAHRIGQKNTVEVIKIICKGTIEEKILELQNKKKILSDKLIDSANGNNTFSKLSEEDVKKLLSFENQK